MPYIQQKSVNMFLHDACEGKECYELIYDVALIKLHDFRIVRLYSPGKEAPQGCTTPTNLKLMN